MFSSILKIDGRFFKEDEINQVIVCPCCLNVYVDPRMLPCGDTICFDCAKTIKEESGSEEIKCPVCQEVHKVSDETHLPRNKALEQLSNKQAHEIYRNESVEELKSHLREIQSKAELFKYSLGFPEQQIQEYCETLRNLVDLAQNKLKQELDQASDALFRQIDAYEKECLESFKELEAGHSGKLEKFKEKIVEYEDSLGEINDFLCEKVNYLKELDIDNREVQNAIEMSKQKLLDLEKHLPLGRRSGIGYLSMSTFTISIPLTCLS
jgi:phage FluMu protein Com